MLPMGNGRKVLPDTMPGGPPLQRSSRIGARAAVGPHPLFS